MEILVKANQKRAILSLAGITAKHRVRRGRCTGRALGPHQGPRRMGPPLAALCDDPVIASAEGYNVIDDPVNGAFDGGLLFGTNGPDLIRANSGNDIVYAGRGNDVICGASASTPSTWRPATTLPSARLTTTG